MSGKCLIKLGNSSKKIQEVIDQNLSENNRLKIQFNNRTLELKSRIEPFDDLFLLLVVIPPILALSMDQNLWSWILASIWFIIFGKKYLQIISSYNKVTLDSINKTLEVEHLHWLYKLINHHTDLTFSDINEVSVSSISYGNVYMSFHYLISIRSRRKNVRLFVLNDSFQSKRLKFVITEFIRSTDN